jgi:hypothetical protein
MGNPDRLAPGWWVRLHGEVFDLEALEKNVSGENLEVVRHGDRFYLRAADFESCAPDDSAGADRRGTEIVRILNAAAKISLGNHHSVSVGATALVSEVGSIQHIVHAAAPVGLAGRMRAKVSTTGEEQRARPSDAERTALRGLADQDVERALAVFGQEDVDYRDLYYVHQEVGAVGSRPDPHARAGWIVRGAEASGPAHDQLARYHA